jgi:epoxyqueuosine reductase
MEDRLERWAKGRGYRAAVGPAELLEEIKSEVTARAARAELDAHLVETCIGWAKSPDAAPAAGPRTVICIAVPSPATLVRFTLTDRVLSALIPPTYGEDARADQKLAEELQEALPELRGAIWPSHFARKALASRLGVTLYGLNNIAYVPGLGSFVRLATFATTAAITAPGGKRTTAAAVLPECASCGRCRDTCPTGAIPADRFLLRGERCLTFINEAPGPWPSWVQPGGHNCLVGCMRCQEACPCNEGLLRTRDTGVLFDMKETMALLAEGTTADAGAEASIAGKLDSLGITGYRRVLGRNLRALAENGR